VGAVVCGWDLTFNFAKLCLASLHLQRSPGLVFVATNTDAFDRLHDRNVPGNGCAVAALETAVGRRAVTVGKPSAWLIQHLLGAHGLDPRRTVVVGDRLDTDIQLGVVGGTDSILVGTGCATLVELEEAAAGDGGGGGMGLPTYILSHVGALAEAANGGSV
jgi:ribonucleotide monophosphatase NagD (HAD superfamily)